MRAAAAASADATQSDVEDVARDLYQSGDAGIGALATVISSGPSGLIDRLDNARKAGAAARGIVNDAQDARAELAMANATVLALTLRIDAASGSVAAAEQSVTAAETALKEIDAQLAALAISAPQQQIGPDGCPTANVPGTLRDGSDTIGAAALCRSAVRQAATPQAALAVQWAFKHLGAPYACGGAGRLQPVPDGLLVVRVAGVRRGCGPAHRRARAGRRRPATWCRGTASRSTRTTRSSPRSPCAPATSSPTTPARRAAAPTSTW